LFGLGGFKVRATFGVVVARREKVLLLFKCHRFNFISYNFSSPRPRLLILPLFVSLQNWILAQRDFLELTSSQPATSDRPELPASFSTLVRNLSRRFKHVLI